MKIAAGSSAPSHERMSEHQLIDYSQFVDSKVRPSVSFWLLVGSMYLFSWAGWVVLGGFLPLYIIPLAPLLVVALLSRSNRMCALEKKSYRTYLLFSLMTFIGVIGAIDPFRALVGSGGWVANFVLIYLTAFVTSSVGRWRGIMMAFALAQSVSFAFAVPQFFFGTFFISPAAYESQVAGLEGMSYAFGKNFLVLVSLGLCALLYKAIFKGAAMRMPVRNLGRFSLILGFMAVALSESRSSQIAILLGSVIIGWRAGLFTGVNLRAVLIGVVFLAAGFYFGAEKWAKVLTEEGLQGDGSFIYRIIAWEASFHMTLDHWFTGVGMGNYRFHVGDYLVGNMDWLGNQGFLNAEGDILVEVHNVFLGIAAMAGIPAALIFAYYYFSVISLCWKISKDPGEVTDLRFIALATGLFLIMYAVSLNMHNLFNDNVPWIIIGAFWGVYRRTNKRKLVNEASHYRWKSIPHGRFVR